MIIVQLVTFCLNVKEFNRFRPERNGHHFEDDVFSTNFPDKNIGILIKSSLNLLPRVQKSVSWWLDTDQAMHYDEHQWCVQLSLKKNALINLNNVSYVYLTDRYEFLKMGCTYKKFRRCGQYNLSSSNQFCKFLAWMEFLNSVFWVWGPFESW